MPGQDRLWSSWCTVAAMNSTPATKLTLIGAGKIGQAIVQLLSAAPEFDVTVIDRDEAALAPLRARGAHAFEVDITDPIALAAQVDGQDMVMSAAPSSTPNLTRAMPSASRPPATSRPNRASFRPGEDGPGSFDFA